MMQNRILSCLKLFMIVFSIGLLSAFVLGCGGSSGDDDDDENNPPLSINGASGNSVSLDGTWNTGCDPDIPDGESETAALTVSGSNFSRIQNEWYDSMTCTGSSDVTVRMSGTVVLGNELSAEMGSTNVTATAIDVVFNTIVGTINNPAVATNFSDDNVCGFNDWVAGTSKNLLGTSCFPDSTSKDIIYVDDVADPDVWYDGDEDGPVDVNGYPTEIESDSSKERV